MSQKPTTYGLPKKRTEVIELLKEAYTNQNLDDQEYERRLDEANNAKSIEDLKLVLFDFPAHIKSKIFPQEAQNFPINQPSGSFLPSLPNNKLQVIMGSESKNMPEFSNALPKISAILSSQRLDFRLSKVPETPINIQVECILSGTQIDLRNDLLDGKVINIHINGGLGEVKILLPRGATINRSIQLIAGELKILDKQRSWINRLTGKSKEQLPEIQLTVNITGIFFLGEIKIIY